MRVRSMMHLYMYIYIYIYIYQYKYTLRAYGIIRAHATVRVQYIMQVQMHGIMRA